MNNFQKHLIKHGSTIRMALERLDYLAKDAIIFVVDDKQILLGSLTDGDVRRGLLKGFAIDNKVEEIIQSHPKFIRKGDFDIAKVIEFREKNFRIIPILDKNNRIVNIVNFREKKSYLPLDAVIMAGGRGERLKPLTDCIPKPMLKVGDKPILEHSIQLLSIYGIENIWITLRYLGDQIENYFGSGEDRNLAIKYIYETEPLGTIGSVSKIKEFIHDNILITNSDLLTNINYEQFYLDFLAQNADLSVVSIPYRVNIPYAVLETNNGVITSFKEKPSYTYYSNGGIYLMKREALDQIPVEKHFNATDFMEAMITTGKKVITYPLDTYWLDIGKQEDYLKAQQDICHLKY